MTNNVEVEIKIEKVHVRISTSSGMSKVHVKPENALRWAGTMIDKELKRDSSDHNED